MSDKLVRIKNRYEHADRWILNNPVLEAGEIGIDNYHNLIKVGNGKDKWTDLSYLGNGRHMQYCKINMGAIDIAAITHKYKTSHNKFDNTVESLYVSDNIMIELHSPGYYIQPEFISGNIPNSDNRGHLIFKAYPLTNGNISYDSGYLTITMNYYNSQYETSRPVILTEFVINDDYCELFGIASFDDYMSGDSSTLGYITVSCVLKQ